MKRWLYVGLGGWGALGCTGDATETRFERQVEQAVTTPAPPVGLSLFFSNGQSAPRTLVAGFSRYLQEIDLVESVTTSSDEGIQPLIESSGVSELDWSGVQQVEELWNPSLDGTMTRERYFRGATWMVNPSNFKLTAVDNDGKPLGKPWVLKAGRDDRLRPPDDFFVRRFVARQTAFGCAAVGDCAGAVFVAEALVQVRGALDPDSAAQLVPSGATELRLSWNRLPEATFSLPIQQIAPDEAAFGYGFEVELDPVSAPENGSFYQPGEAVTFRVTFRDGQGTALHPEGQLPTYDEFVTGQVESGLRYLDLQIPTRLYYALKHRESNLLAVLSGPTHELRTPQTVVDPNHFFAPQVPFATVGVDGFTAVGQIVPPAGLIFGGFVDPGLWSVPVSDLVTFTIPEDAEAGTYVAAIKARRDYAGEALNRGTSVEIQVGQASPTTFTPKTACASCHTEERRSLSTLLHGFDDKKACFGCHSSLGIEFDGALDIRVHAIHDRSNRFPADIQNCSLCHLSPPDGPQRGVLP